MPTNEEVNLKVNIEFHPELINRAAEAIKRLAERLSTLLDDDQFNNLEPELQAISACLVSAKTNVVPASTVELNDSQLLDALDERIAALNLRWLARNDGYPGISTAPGAERHGIRDAMRALLVLMPSCLREGGFAVMPQQQAEPTVQRCTSCGGAKVPQTLLSTGACDCERAEPGADERPIYQLRLANGDWRDQTEQSYLNNQQHCASDTRIVYTHHEASAPSQAI